MEVREQPALGARIKELREGVGLGQQDLAEAVGLTQPDISKVERGERSVSASEACRVADALAVTVNDILLREDARELQIALRRDTATDEGARQAIGLIEDMAARLDHLRALLP